MKLTYVIYGGTIIGLIVIIGLFILLAPMQPETTLEFQVIDTMSKNWVWDLTAAFQDRYINSYYQSNTGPVVFRFTGLAPGDWTMELSAPSYEPVSIPVQIRKGVNKIENPIEMRGYEIPGMREIFVKTEWQDGELILNPRPIDGEGMGIGTHPCLNMWFGLRISVQTKDGIIIQEPVESGSARGEELFRGKCEWEWESDPTIFYRYIVRLPYTKIKQHNAPYRVFDYLIVFNDPRKMDNETLDREMEKTFSLADETELTLFLESFGDSITYFITASWNQPAI
jgi:hypothetical protein